MANAQVIGVITTTETNVVSISANFTCQNYNQLVINTVEGTTVTLPDNPLAGETHQIVAQDGGCFLTGAPNNLLAVDPLYVPQGSNTTVVYGTDGWSGGVLNRGVATDVYGDGSDGAAHFDGTNAVVGATTTGSSPNKIYTISRDVFYTTCLVDAGITVNTGGAGGNFRVYADFSLINNGIIQANGGDAVTTTAGAATAVGTLGSSGAGGAGGNNGAGGAGGVITNGVIIKQNGAAGTGAGGIGGTPSAGAAGTYAGMIASVGSIHAFPMSALGAAISQSGVVAVRGGAGGGGGGSNNADTSGGGGGGGGGIVDLVAYQLFNSTTGVIRAQGGAGASASGAGHDGGTGGGGGGGTILTTSRSYVNQGVVSVNGGAAGVTIVGAGTLGAVGVNGNVMHFTM